jgi:DNA-binding transcriptional LysR family regulator
MDPTIHSGKNIVNTMEKMCILRDAMIKRANIDPALLDIKLLQMFDTLYSSQSVTRTAELLGQSQPTVSIWLGQLRRLLRDPLFVRTPAGMQPTPQADSLIGTTREILESLRRLSAWEPSFAPATAQRRFRICMTDASHITLLPQLLAHVRASAPSVRLEAARIDSHTEQALHSGEADLALGYIPWLESGIYQQTLYPQDWVCLANARHPRIGKTLSLAAYENEAHAGIVSGTGYQLLEAAVTSRRITRRVLLELPGFLGLGAIVSTTDLIVTLPRHIGETLAKASGLVVFDCPFPIPSFTVKQHWHARYHHDAGNRWLRGICAGLFMQRTIRGAGDRRQPAGHKPSPASRRVRKN